MRVALVHNFYRGVIPSGEDLNVREHQSVVGPDIEVVLNSTGNTYVDQHPVRGRWRVVASALDLPTTERGLVDAVLSGSPDCVHVENLAPLLPESLVPALLDHVRVVRRWNNYRFRCPSGNNFRDGRECHECDALRISRPAVRHRCYAGSTLASAAVAVRPDPLLRGSGLVHVPVSRHIGDQLVAAGLSPDEVSVIPPAVPRSSSPARSSTGRELLYVGSLAEKKGVSRLLEAWELVAQTHPEARLRVIGEGPLGPVVRRAADADRRLVFDGALDYPGVRAAMSAAHAVVAPSLWDEPFGRVAAEALAEGVPVVASCHGGLPEVVSEECGWVVDPSTIEGLASVLDDALGLSGTERRAMGDAARQRHNDVFSVEAVRPRWRALYEGER